MYETLWVLLWLFVLGPAVLSVLGPIIEFIIDALLDKPKE